MSEEEHGPQRRVRRVASRAILGAARRLRGEQTPPEELLWAQLRAKGLNGAKFRRQHPIGRFVVDLFCREALLAVEVDGKCHQESVEADAERDEWLRGQGIRVLRLPASLVLADLDAALDAIRAALRTGP